jgi:two-component system, OmpR family, response regulator ResD
MTDGDQHVLIIDDEAQIRQFIRAGMELGGYRVSEAANGNDALREITLHPIDLVILDLALPDIDGSELLERIRGWSGVPVIILSVRAGETEKVKLLELGADDYVVKPFSPAELVARVDAVLRRSEASADQELAIEFKGLRIDPSARRVFVRGEETQLTHREFELLLFFARHPGQAFSRNQLMDAVWRYSFYTDTSTVTVHLRRLRSKIELNPAEPLRLQTVWGVGYRFQP